MGFLSDFLDKNNSKIVDKKQGPSSFFFDENLSLDWVRVSVDNFKKFDWCFDELSKWSTSDSVKKFISSNVSLDKLFKYFYAKRDGADSSEDRRNLYFCFNKSSELVGLVYITAPLGKLESSSIEYLIVNPAFQNKGVGTRMIKSIGSNIVYFNNGYLSTGITTSVESDNVASYRAFLKNNFKVVSGNWSDTGKYYRVMYLNKRDLIKDKSGKEAVDE